MVYAKRLFSVETSSCTAFMMPLSTALDKFGNTNLQEEDQDNRGMFVNKLDCACAEWVVRKGLSNRQIYAN